MQDADLVIVEPWVTCFDCLGINVRRPERRNGIIIGPP